MILSEENLSLSNVQQLHIFEEQTTQGFHHMCLHCTHLRVYITLVF